MSWQILILLSVLLYSASVLLQRVLLKEDKSDPVAYSIFFQLSIGLLIGLFGFLFADMRIPDLTPVMWNFLAMILLYGFANIAIFYALKKLEASTFTVLFATRALFGILASSFFLKETLNSGQWMGALLILAGVVLVAGNVKKLRLDKTELVALFAAFCFGLANTNDKVLLKTFDIYPYVSVAFILPAIFIAVIYPKKVSKLRLFLNKELLSKMLMLCISYGAAAIAFFAALQTAPNASQVITINLTGVVVTVLLSIVILKERTNMPKKILGALLSFVGLLFVS